MDELKSRVLIRLPEARDAEGLVLELLTTIADRILLILAEDALPRRFHSIVVDATVKSYRRIYYEGVETETTGSLKTDFVENILAEYAQEFDAYKEKKRKVELEQKGKGRVRFL